MFQNMEQAELSLLPALDALLQEGSVTGAAQRLGLSKPAVSYLLGRLREQTGDPLLIRAGRAMVRTPYAEELRERVHDLHAEARQLLLPREPVALEEIERSFVIRCTDYVLSLFAAELDKAVSHVAPGIRLRFVPNARDDVESLNEGQTDLAVGIYGTLPASLRSRILVTDRHVCVVRRGHPEVGKRMTLHTYVSLPHIQIAPRGTPGGYIDDLLASRGVSRVVSRAVPYFSAALELVSRTDYILTVSERIATRRLNDLKLDLFPLPFESDPYALSLLWHPRFDGDPAHQLLRQIFVEVSERTAGDRHPRFRRHLK